MPKWKTIRVRQELLEEVKKEIEKGQYPSLSEFVSEAIRNRMQKLVKERIPEYLERDRHIEISKLKARLFCTPKHIWAQATPQRTIKIGITDYLQRKAKEVVNIKTDEAGKTVFKDEPFGVVETWWFVYDLYSPLNGKIISVNKAIVEDPFTLNADPYQWVVEVEPIHTEVNSWMGGLLNLEEYEKLVTKFEGIPMHVQAALAQEEVKKIG